MKFGTCGKILFAPIVHKKNHILVINDNTYIASQRMKVYFIDFLFIQNSMSFTTNVTCNMSNVLKKYFTCKCCFQLKISRKDQLQNGHFRLVFLMGSNT